MFTALAACTTANEDLTQDYGNPPVEGFNLEASDPRAIEIADNVMLAMGGRKAWDDLQYVSWKFFGARDLIWDKKNGRVRIDFPAQNACYLINVNDSTGSVFIDGNPITEADSLKKMIIQGKNIWINDSYWLFMPFKLKDTGVTLTYLREDTLPGGNLADVLQMTFNDVGVTPDNKYEVYVDQTDSLVKQWAYFQQYTQDTASAVWPWDNYQQYGGLLLSAERSDNRGPSRVQVFAELPDAVFSDPEAVPMSGE